MIATCNTLGFFVHSIAKSGHNCFLRDIFHLTVAIYGRSLQRHVVIGGHTTHRLLLIPEVCRYLYEKLPS